MVQSLFHRSEHRTQPKPRDERHSIRHSRRASHQLGVFETNTYLEARPDQRYAIYLRLGFGPHSSLASPVPNLTELWTEEYLCRRSADRLLSIAVTPNGYDLLFHTSFVVDHEESGEQTRLQEVLTRSSISSNP